MMYQIHARLVGKQPQLDIIDAATGSTCVSWRYSQHQSGDHSESLEIKRLFRQLFILGCKERLRMGRQQSPGVGVKNRLVIDLNKNINSWELPPSTQS